MPPRAHSAAPSTELHQGDAEPDEEGDIYTSGDNTRQQQQQAGSAGEEDDNDNEEAFLFISRLPPLHLCTPAGREAALPPKAASAPPCTLVLDLDETLVHSSLDPGSGVSTAGPHDFAFPVQFEDALHTVYVRKRPGLQARACGTPPAVWLCQEARVWRWAQGSACLPPLTLACLSSPVLRRRFWST